MSCCGLHFLPNNSTRSSALLDNPINQRWGKSSPSVRQWTETTTGQQTKYESSAHLWHWYTALVSWKCVCVWHGYECINRLVSLRYLNTSCCGVEKDLPTKHIQPAFVPKPSTEEGLEDDYHTLCMKLHTAEVISVYPPCWICKIHFFY